MTVTTTTETRVQRHPVRGALYGLCLGISVAIYLVLFAVTPFRITTLVVIVLIGAALGAAWGSLAPPKKLTDVPAGTAAFGTSYIRTEEVDRGPAPTYEETFGAAAPPSDDGSFGAPGQAPPAEPTPPADPPTPPPTT